MFCYFIISKEFVGAPPFTRVLCVFGHALTLLLRQHAVTPLIDLRSPCAAIFIDYAVTLSFH